ncbi:MAG: M20/M25/M40 family metallo-hydrolase, partial [Bacteroidia bacterium]|nr:M20/M25/M40 family metallo-hydrolase [Bacteroidia bacterium]
MIRLMFSTLLSAFLFFSGYTQSTADEIQLAKIRNAGLLQSDAMHMLKEFTDVYGQRLTGSREYLAAAKWTAQKMKDIGLQNVHFENFCKDCRGWNVKSFNVEMVSPNYMHIMAYPLAMTKSSAGLVEGELVNIGSFKDMDSVKAQFTGKLKGKIILLGTEPRQISLTDTISKRFTDEELKNKEEQLNPVVKQLGLQEQLDDWKITDHTDKDFLAFAEKEGAIAVLKTTPKLLGVLQVQGTYNYMESDPKVLPYFAIMPEHFGRLIRLLKQQVMPRIRLNLETSFYLEPDNNVNIIGEITGSDPKLKDEVVLIGGHFDSWHSGTGATDNGVSCMTLLESLRILKQSGISPKRTIRIGLWGGEEQAFIGSVAYATQHFGALNEQPNNESKKVTAYLNLDNGAGAIRGIYLQGNEFARPVFKNIFNS